MHGILSLPLAIEDNEWSLSLLIFLKLLFQIQFFGLVLCMTKKAYFVTSQECALYFCKVSLFQVTYL